MSLTAPVKFSVPFSIDGNRNTITYTQEAGDGANKATFRYGFPQITMTPKSAGGLPPFGRDMNGILYAITEAIQYQQAGGTFPFDSDFATAIGGYGKGAMVQQADLTGVWVSQVNNNTTNPETNSSAWQPLDAGSYSFNVSGSNVTLTNAQAAHPVLIVGGTLTNSVIITVPTFRQIWTVVNNVTRGQYSLTIKTASGTGVALKSAVEQVVCDGTNVYRVGTDSSQTVPTGAVIPHFGASVPDGYLLANGQAVSRTLYSDLFSVCGTMYGSGDGSTTFNVPNLIGRFIRYGNVSDVGTKVADSIRSHTHTVTQTAHNHGITDTGHTHTATTSPAGEHSHNRGTMEITGSAQFAIRRSGSAGGAMSFENWDSYRGDADGDGNRQSRQLNFKASDAWTGSTNSTGLHTHSLTTNSAMSGVSVNGATANITIDSTGGTETAPMHIFGLPIIKA